jgi:hypothetical protein
VKSTVNKKRSLKKNHTVKPGGYQGAEVDVPRERVDLPRAVIPGKAAGELRRHPDQSFFSQGDGIGTISFQEHG